MHDWFGGAGPIVSLIWVVAGLGALLVVDRIYVVLVRSGFNGRPLIERVIQLVRTGKIDEAIKVCSANRTVLSDIGLLILRTRTQNEADLQHIAEAAALSLVPRLRRRLHYFVVLAVASTSLGVIGLLDGLRLAFAQGSASAGFSGAVAEAIRAPELGIALAAVLILAQGVFVAQSEQVVDQVDELSARLVNALIDRPDVRLGHR